MDKLTKKAAQQERPITHYRKVVHDFRLDKGMQHK